MRRVVPAIVALATLVLGLPGRAAPPERADAGEPSSKSGTRYVVAAIGDSLTDPRAGGGKYLRGLARRCPESRFDAYGVGGQRTDHMRWRFMQDLFAKNTPWRKKPKYTHVIVLGGINDLAATSLFSASVTRIERNLSYMYEKGRKSGVAVVAVTVPPWGRLKGVRDARVEATARLNRWITSAEQRGIVEHAVDIHPLLSCGDPAVLCPAYRRFVDDQIHWGEAGHEVVAETLYQRAFSDCR